MARNDMTRNSEIWFHAPCFDGVVSAALALDFLEKRRGWDDVRLRPVDYDAQDSWLEQELASRSAVVDFLYHPAADFWADHHVTTFLSGIDEDTWSDDADAETIRLYDPSTRSCALLLWECLARDFGHRDARFEDYVAWAHKIDSASYESAEEAVVGASPALRVATSLAGASQDYCAALVRWARSMTLDELAAEPAVSTRYAMAAGGLERGARRMAESLRQLARSRIVTFDIDTTDIVYNRFVPFYFVPESHYAVGVIRRGAGWAKVTAMKNPWADIDGVDLGPLCVAYGGGGHRGIGSIILGFDRIGQAVDIRDELVDAIRRHGAATSKAVS